jgi:hypothetical protein
MPLHVHFILLAQTEKEIACHPDIVSGFLGAFAEDLELPLTLRHFGVDAFVVDASVQTEV